MSARARFVLAVLLAAPAAAPAASPPALAAIRASCELASPPIRAARSALERASWFAPASGVLATKERQLRDGEYDIAAATTPGGVASAFGVAVSGKPVLADIPIDPPSACSYSTLEIVAIVLGFILGVIPGIILLILLC